MQNNEQVITNNSAVATLQQNKIVSLFGYDALTSIGKSMCEVLKAHKDGQMYAIKTTHSKHKFLPKMLVHEYQLMKALNNTHITKVIELCEPTEHQCGFVMELADMSLMDWYFSAQKSGKLMSLPLIKEILYQCGKGLDYLH